MTAPVKTGTCLVCGQNVAVVNYQAATTRHPWEGGYLGRHGRPGVRWDAKCRGSFGGWKEKVRG